ncbi:MAG: esterase/lipase family protein [Anaerolineales bacterium]
MFEITENAWHVVRGELALYRYAGPHTAPAHAQAPIVMLHGPMTSHRTWDVMAAYLWENGFGALYAIDIPDIQNGGSLRNATKHLLKVMYFLLEEHRLTRDFVLIGHSTGGVLARRFLFKHPEIAPHIAYLFTLASPHTRTHFSYRVYVPPETENTEKVGTGSSSVVTPDIPHNTFILNFFGNAVGPFFDGTVRGVFLPEAANQMLLLQHADFKQASIVLEEILACLYGKRYRMQIFLHSLYMKTPDQGELVGPFYFEINGIRTPFDGIFQAVAEHEYLFDESSTPLATLSYPPGNALVSTVFRLKDQSKARPVRRRLFAKLLVSLADDENTLHEMQDNEGSKITVRIHTQAMPCLVNDAPQTD